MGGFRPWRSFDWKDGLKVKPLVPVVSFCIVYKSGENQLRPRFIYSYFVGDVDAYIRRVGSRSPLQQGSGLLCNRAETERGGGGIRVG